MLMCCEGKVTVPCLCRALRLRQDTPTFWGFFEIDGISLGGFRVNSIGAQVYHTVSGAWQNLNLVETSNVKRSGSRISEPSEMKLTPTAHDVEVNNGLGGRIRSDIDLTHGSDK